ncbi:hypothetical protein PMAYCL1PPCAC_13475, partial [Pristionchus mayeri]
LDGSLFEFNQKEENGQEIENERMDESKKEGKGEKLSHKENRKVDILYRAMTEISERENGIRSLYRIVCRKIEEAASIKMSLSQWKNLLRMFEKSEERLKEGYEILDVIYNSNRDMNMEIRKKEMRKVIKGISTRIILAKLAEFKKKFVGEVNGNEKAKRIKMKVGSYNIFEILLVVRF